MDTTTLFLLRTLRITAITSTLGFAAPLMAQNDQQDAPPPETTTEKDTPEFNTKSPKNRLIEQLLAEVKSLRAEVAQARQDVANAQLERDEFARELDELRQFMRDNREFGDDFAQYKEIKEITRLTERRRAAQEHRQRQEEARARRLAARNGGSEDQQDLAEQEKIKRFQRAGFQPLGLDVFLGRTGFFYGVKEGPATLRIEYEPIIGDFLEPGHPPTSRIDFSAMTISGTVLNASNQTRNVGIAIAFFDNRGNQVGSETIQLKNARPNVPYPFTSTIKMGLDEAFASSTSWVLYADPVE